LVTRCSGFLRDVLVLVFYRKERKLDDFSLRRDWGCNVCSRLVNFNFFYDFDSIYRARTIDGSRCGRFCFNWCREH
jgi:hypothetical protein